jgi:hypothetical protein
MYFRDCKTLSVFERKIPLTEFRFHQRVKTVVIESSLIQVSDYRLLGASGLRYGGLSMNNLG